VPVDPDDLLADWGRRAEQQATLTAELSERMQQTTATVEAHGGEAVVTVDSSGGLAALRLTERAMRLSAGELAEIILVTSRRAQATMAQEIAGVVADVYGAGSETASFITGAYTTQFPELPEDEERARR
jgi:hypothetical protein